MTFSVKFSDSADKEWKKLDRTIQKQFAKKLIERKDNPRVEADRLHDMNDCYKIKLRAVGYRLVYQVIDNILVIHVIAIGKRDRNQVYETAKSRLP